MYQAIFRSRGWSRQPHGIYLVLGLVLGSLLFALRPAQPLWAASAITVDTVTDNASATACTAAAADCSLRGAIAFANANAGTTINLPAGTYILTLGELVISNPAGTNTVIKGLSDSTTIIRQDTANSRIFSIDPAALSPTVQVSISDVKLMGGSSPTSRGGIRAGGVNHTLTLNNCTFDSNSAPSATPAGGAIAFAGGGFLSISNCTFTNNSASTTGGAIDFQLPDNGQPGGMSITNSSFSNNKAGGSNGAGGAVNVVNTTTTSPHDVTITNNTFVNNQATNAANPFGNGGAIASASSNPLTVKFNRFFGNTATGTGSGIYQAGSAPGQIDATLNWWGCNGGPGTTGCDNVSGNVLANPRLFMTFTANPNPTGTGGSTTLTLSLLTDSANNPVSLSNLSRLIGLPVTFSNPVLGTLVNPQTSISIAGTATVTFLAGSTGGTGSALAQMDNGTAAATFAINTSPLVTIPPLNQAVCVGAKATFTAAATGSPAPTVQWQVSSNQGTSFSNISGATATTYSFTTKATDNGKQYRALFSNSAGITPSSAATVTVATTPAITTQPANQTVVAGKAVTFTVKSSNIPAATVQWQRSNDKGAHWNAVTNAISPTLTFTTTSADNISQFRAVLTTLCGNLNSKAAILTVNTPPQLTLQPVDQYVNAKQSVSFSAAATGSPNPSAQWQVSTNQGTTWSNVAKATTPILTFTAQSTDNGKFYRVIFTNAAGVVTSNSAMLIIKVVPTVTTQPTDQTVNAGEVVSFTAAASGNPAPTVQWQRSINQGSSWEDLTGAISLTLHFTAQSSDIDSQYRAIFTNIAGTATTSAAMLTVNSQPTITLQPADQAVNAGQLVTFTVSAAGVPAPTVQWQVGSNLRTSWSDLPGAITPTLVFTAQYSDDGNAYRAVFSNLVGSTISQQANLSLNLPPAITEHPSDQTVNAGQTVNFHAAANGRPAPTLQWQISSDGVNWQDIPNAITPNLTFTAQSSDSNNLYRAVFTNVAGTSTSNAATLAVVVAAGPVVTTPPTDQAVCERSTVIFFAAASGVPTPNVQWQLSTDHGGTWNNLLGATSSALIFTAQNADHEHQYRAIFANTTGKATSPAASLTINQAPGILIHPGDQTAEVGHTIAFTATASGLPRPTVQWQVSRDDGLNWQPVSGAISSTLTFVGQGADNHNQYRAIFTNACGTVTSNAAVLTLTGILPGDTASPETIIESQPADPSSSTSATFVFTGTDDISSPVALSFECKLDAELFAACASNREQGYSQLSQGSHTFQVRAIDAAGNVDHTPASYSWTIQISSETQVGECGGYQVVKNSQGQYEANGWKGNILVGTANNDLLKGTDEPDLILGLSGDDTLLGQGANDLLCGNDGDDRLGGDKGDFDRLLGGNGNDQLFDADGVVEANGGDGNDTLTIVLRGGWRDQSGQARVEQLIAGGYQSDTIALYMADATAYFVNITGDAYDTPPATAEGDQDRLDLRANLMANPIIVKFENPQVSAFDNSVGALAPPPWDQEVLPTLATFLPMVTR